MIRCTVADDAEVAGRIYAWDWDGNVHRMSVSSVRWSQLPSCRSVRRVITIIFFKFCFIIVLLSFYK